MKFLDTVILAGGFAKRMWPLTYEIPKVLLDVAGKPVLTHIINKLEPVENIDTIYLSINNKFKDHFSAWQNTIETSKKIELVVEPSNDEKGKLGSIGALDYLIKNKNINRDLFVIGGDNLFEFDISKFINFFKENKSSAVLGFYDLGNKKEASKFGVVKINSENKVIEFEEKPKNPKSSMVSTCIYMFSKDCLGLISQYLENGNDKDVMGHFIKWLHRKSDVHGFVFNENWFDIGSMETYKKVNEFYKNNGN